MNSGFECPVCNREMMGSSEACSGSFTERDHPTNVAPVPAARRKQVVPADCDDLCTCGHERFHHDDGREMGVETNCKARREGSPCTCKQFELVDDEEIVGQSPAEPQGDVVEKVARLINPTAFEKSSGFGHAEFHEEDREERAAAREKARELLTPLLPGSSELEQIAQIIDYDPAEVADGEEITLADSLRDLLDIRNGEIEALKEAGSSYVRERLGAEIAEYNRQVASARKEGNVSAALFAASSANALERSLAALDTPVPSEPKEGK